MRFYKKKDFHLHKIIQNRGLLSVCLSASLSVCLSVLLMNKTSTNSLIFYFDKAKQKNVCWGYMKYFVLLSRNNPLMLKGLKLVNLKIIQMYHFRLKLKRYTVCTNWWDSNFFWVGLPLFPVGLLLFARWESWTPVFKILVRALVSVTFLQLKSCFSHFKEVFVKSI